MPRRHPASPHPAIEARFQAARARYLRGEADAALAAFRALALRPDPEVRRRALEKVASYLPAAPGAGNFGILSARRQWTALEARSLGAPPPFPPVDPARRLRIGYVSAFFNCRNWMKPVWGVLRAHDRRAYEVHLFIEGGLPDRRHGFAPDPRDRLHPIDDLSNPEAARQVAAAGIDILVDLNAYSWAPRIGLFLLRPAPVQLGWFNTFATSGTPAFDYAVADAVVLPRREERFYAERILRVSGSYLAFTCRYRTPDPGPPPCLREPFTFGCLAPLYKVNDRVLATFAALLRAAPQARLLLRNTALEDPAVRERVAERFRAHGVAARQLLLGGPAEHYRFLAAYRRIDIALDTFPYSGGVTTMEALWQGVPVLTCGGDRWSARTTASLLRAARLGAWVVRSPGELVRRAAALARAAQTPRRLSLLRRTLRSRLRASPAGDVRGLCRELEAHYQAIAAPRPGRRAGPASRRRGISSPSRP